MIRIEIDLAVSLYLGLSILIMLIWIGFEREKRNRSEKAPKNSLWQCPTCFYTYIDSCSDSISQCPKCKSLHKKEEKV